MAKIIFTAELSFVSDADITAAQAVAQLKDGMSMWPSCNAPHVSINIKGITCDGIPMNPYKTTE